MIEDLHGAAYLAHVLAILIVVVLAVWVAWRPIWVPGPVMPLILFCGADPDRPVLPAQDRVHVSRRASRRQVNRQAGLGLLRARSLRGPNHEVSENDLDALFLNLRRWQR